MRHTVLVFGSDAQRKRAAAAIARHLGADCQTLSGGSIAAWETIVEERLAHDRHIVVCATDGRPAEGDAALPLVSNRRSFNRRPLAVWALGGNDAGLNDWMKRLERGEATGGWPLRRNFPTGSRWCRRAVSASAFRLEGDVEAAPARRRNGTARRGVLTASAVADTGAAEAAPDGGTLTVTRRAVEGISPARALERWNTRSSHSCASTSPDASGPCAGAGGAVQRRSRVGGARCAKTW